MREIHMSQIEPETEAPIQVAHYGEAVLAITTNHRQLNFRCDPYDCHENT